MLTNSNDNDFKRLIEKGPFVFISLFKISNFALLYPRVDPYGFERSEDFDYESYEELMSEYLVLLTRRSIKWSKLLKGKSKVKKNVKCKREK